MTEDPAKSPGAITRQHAATRLRELAHELQLLLELFPDIQDAFDEDELPVSFIVKRDAGADADHLAQIGPSRTAARAVVDRRMNWIRQSWTGRRARKKK
jgi:hypothetical protein